QPAVSPGSVAEHGSPRPRRGSSTCEVLSAERGIASLELLLPATPGLFRARARVRGTVAPGRSLKYVGDERKHGGVITGESLARADAQRAPDGEDVNIVGVEVGLHRFLPVVFRSECRGGAFPKPPPHS